MKEHAILHQLIKTFSKSEKRYFKLFASRGTNNGSDEAAIRLFDQFDKQELKEEQREKETHSAAFSETALRLNDLIMKSLHSFHEEKTPEPRIRAQLHYTELLLAKGLEKHARQQLKVARDIARKHELLEYMPAILELELAMADKDNREVQYKKAQLFYDEYCDALSRLEVQSLYAKLLKEVNLFAQRTPYQRSKKNDFADIDTFLAMNEVKAELGPSSIRSQFFFNDIHVVAAYIKADYNTMYFYSSRLVRMAQEHPDVLQYETEKYVSILSRHASASALMRLPHELLETARLLRAINTTDERQKVKIFVNAMSAEFNTCVLQRDPELIRKSLQQLEEGYETFHKRLDSTYAFLLPAQGATWAFVMGDMQKSLHWSEIALSTGSMHDREDIMLPVRITQIQSLYELGDFEKLRQKTRALYRYLMGKTAHYRIEKALVEHIRSLARSTAPDKEKRFFTGLRDSIAAALTESPDDRRFFGGYTDLVAWIDSKVLGAAPLLPLLTEEEAPAPKKAARKTTRKKS